MVNLIYGKRNSGKSAYFEALLEEKANKVYFATLWYGEETKACIEQHKLRRGEGWIEHESVGNISNDIQGLEQIIKGAGAPLHCMIDGLTNWCRFAAKGNFDYIAEAKNIASAIIYITSNYEGVEWYFLDCLKEDFVETPILLETWEIIYSVLKNGIENIALFDWDSNLLEPIKRKKMI
jgi:adenosyl cobinamide kinase/adenosyl cobinamide phosphate guanylyltransferase